MPSDIVIKAENLSKCYQIYDQPRDRLKQFVLPRLQGLVGLPPKNFYQEFWAVKDVSFEVNKGEAVGIIGRNGSGKSTLLQMITGVLSPTSGVVSTQGRIAALLELGSGFNPNFTGRENVYLNGALLGFTRDQIEDRFDAIAGFADIGLHLDQPVKTYSSGMMLRLAFAVQVQVEPDILIVDEALAVGDALFQKRCFQRIEKLLSDGTTLLFVSHDQESVRTLTNRAVFLNKGQIAAYGVSSEVVLEYRRQLHVAESSYFSDVAKRLADKAAQTSTTDPDAVAGALIPEAGESPPAGTSRSDKLSFGDGEAKILKIETLGADGVPATVFYPGDIVRIKVTCKSVINTDKLNVGIRIRNKEGVKIYSWGTLNQDMEVLARNSRDEIFWSRQAKAGEIFDVELEMQCSLGVNLYEVQGSISYEENPDYTAQRILHWVDEAAFFQVLMRREEHFFGGVADLKMRARW
ncbi:ABC transporter ATP-binding protein [Pseudomonas chengduensis]|nr:ABC transporter ATP-binding protein [Pseudomonas chengduensis]MDH1683281.1 ABC transporter ATP-binding protein [Pseudomonas chengduensis]